MCHSFYKTIAGAPPDPTTSDSTALLYAFLGCILGWIATELLTIGVKISKSALAAYAEQVGVVVPFCFDSLILGRLFLKTDLIAVVLIVTLQVVMAFHSLRNANKGSLEENSRPSESDEFSKFEEKGGDGIDENRE